MALIAWPTANANSYILQADATTYFSLRIGSDAWTAATTGTKDSALVTATRMLDRMVWTGEKTAADQDLEFPRTGLTDKDGNEVASDAIPQEILDATCELALILIVNASAADVTSTASNIKKLQAGSAMIEYFKGSSPGTPFPPVIMQLIAVFLRSSAGTVGIGGLYSEDDGFDDCDNTNGLTGGI